MLIVARVAKSEGKLRDYYLAQRSSQLNLNQFIDKLIYSIKHFMGSKD